MSPSNDFENLDDYSEADVAIVGMALRAPGARNIGDFWTNLRNGTSSIRRLSTEELDAAGESPARYLRPNYVPFAAELPDMEMFDADFFGLSPKEAAIMDPQQRQFLECAWEALEDAARPPESVGGPVGVFAGCGMGSYFYFNICSQRDLVDQVGMFLLRHTGNDKDFLATRVSYTFDLQGPSVNVQTACSTSLVAVHYACQSLLSRECDMALAGGVTIELPHRRGYLYAKDEILSPDGCCRAFDHRAAGTVFGSGVGVVALRRLADAVADGDPIHAVIKGAAINNDGRAKATYLAPSVDGQARAVIEAQGIAGVPADAIGYVECHGTGTALGDPIEIEALTHAFRQSTARTGFCRVGSVKTNIGHLDTAAGVVGLIKAALSLEHGEMPPTIGFEAPNPAIDFAGSPFVVNDRLTPWPADGAPRFAAVNSLGVGGTNAHVVLQDAPRRRRPSAVRGRGDEAPLPIVLTAKSRKALDAAAEALAAALDREPERALADVSHTLLVGRRPFEHRRALAARSPGEAARLLRGGDARRVHGHSPVEGDASAVFLFPGGGAQHPGMAKRLYEEHAGFRASVDEGLFYLPEDARAEIRSLWLCADEDRAEAARAFLAPSRQLPAILIVEVALARLWMAHGVRPSALVGHSMGENAAACVAGVLSFRDAVGLVRLRGELFDTVPAGGMLSVVMAPDALAARLPAGLDLASVNAPELCVVSGPAPALASFQAELEAEGVDATRVAIDIAAHSRMLEPILARFEAYLRSITLKAPEIPIVSNLTGDVLSAADACDPVYWRLHLRSTVRFADCVARLSSDRSLVYVEVGPGKTLSSLAKAQRRIDANVVINALPHAEEAGADDHAHLVAALARAWATGLKVEFTDAAARPERIRLPAYQFQRQRYFYERAAPAAQDAVDALIRRPDIADWGYVPAWRQVAADIASDRSATPRTWLVFLDEDGVGSGLAERLRGRGDEVATVRLADQFARRDRGDYALCPEGGRPGYEALFSALKLDGLAPDRILHLWLLTADESFRPGSSLFHRNQERGFFSLLHLAQALGEGGGADGVHITVATNGMQKIGDRLALYPDKATIVGPARVMPKEMPGVTVRLVDVELAPEPSVPTSTAIRRRLAASLDPRLRREPSPRERTLDLLWEDLLAAPANETVAYDGGRRWRQEHERLTLDREEEGGALFRPRGAYLVTGGAGGVGLAISETLAERFRARLAFVGRTRLPDRPFWPGYLRMHGAATRIGRTIAAIERLETLGAEVLYICGDVSNPEDVRGAVAETRAAFGALHGVIHAAGAVHDDLIELKTAESIEAVFAPKLLGAANLDEAVRDIPLDLFLMFSSTSVATAPAGQIDYVAANAYLNALASSRNAGDGRRTIAIQWGVWAEVGMAARAAAGDAVATESSPTFGPLFERWVDEDDQRWLEGVWGPSTHWHLDEHRLATGEAIWPGTGYLEAAAQALREHGLDGGFEIENLEFLRPLHVSDGKARIVRARLTPADRGFAFELTSASEDQPDQFTSHAQARLVGGQVMSPGGVDLDAVAARCGAPRSARPGEAIPAAQERHLRFGPRWRVLRSVALGRGEALATLELPPDVRSDQDDGHRLHAGLLDIATGYAMELIDGYDPAGGLWAPISYGKARIFDDLPARVRSWARLSTETSPDDGYASFDVTLVNDEGEVVFEVERLTVRRLGAKITLATAAGAPAGKARRPQSAASAALMDQVAQGIRPAEGGRALLRAVGAGRSEIIVSSMDLDLLKQAAAAPPSRPQAVAFDRPELDTEFVAPATKAEKVLAGFWSELLGVEKIGVNDDFFALGGHSLVAVRLFRMIKETFAVSLPISALFEAPTISQCAALLGAADDEDAAAAAPGVAARPQFLHVVPMAGLDRASQTPFFLCAGMFGNVLNLRHLALMLGADRPIYGLQARGLYGDLPPHESFEEMAEDYCRELRQVQPEGPYLIGGFSGGGLTAYAMAQRLADEGQQVAELVMLDTPLPGMPPLSFTDLVAMKAQDFEKQRGAFLRNWATRRARWEAERLMGRLRAPEALPSEQFHDAAIEAAFYRALARFEVRPYRGSTLLLRPRLQVAYSLSGGRRLDVNRRLLAEDNGWGAFASRLTVVEAPGDHDSMVLEPNVRVLASHIRSRLASAQPEGGRLFAAE